MEFIKKLKFDSQGLIPVIIQEMKSKDVLMMAYMNKESLRRTLSSRKTVFYSRKRKRLWLKGETSKHFQEVKGIYLDCDQDTLLIKVRQIGGACHQGYKSCFYRRLKKDGNLQIVRKKVFNPGKVYKDIETEDRG